MKSRSGILNQITKEVSFPTKNLIWKASLTKGERLSEESIQPIRQPFI